MKSGIKNKYKAGFVELLLVLPLFLGLACMVAGLGCIMIWKTRLEKNAWTSQIQKTYELPTSHNIVESHIDSSSSMVHLSLIPMAFRNFLSLHPAVLGKLKHREDFSTIVQWIYQASFDQTYPKSGFEIETEISTPGHSMKKSWVTKNELWIENMRKSGFDYIFLQEVGYRELIDAAVPVDHLKISLPEDLKKMAVK